MAARKKPAEQVDGAPVPFAVVGEDGRRIFRHLTEDEANREAEKLSAQTGEHLDIVEDLPAD